jgi:M6 family metalloprotease-like protein
MGMLVAVGFTLLSSVANIPVEAYTGTYNEAIIRVKFSDTTSTPYTLTQLQQAATEIHDFFSLLSYSKLGMQVTAVEVQLNNPSTSYNNVDQLIQDAAQAAATAHFDFTSINGISVLYPFCGGDWTNGAIAINIPNQVNGTFQRSYIHECGGDPNQTPWLNLGPSKVGWGSWAHEMGHQLELADGVTLGGNWNGHPGAYSSGYDLMDSCYPCDASAYSLSGPPVMNSTKKVFGGWLPSQQFVEVDAPQQGFNGATVVLAPVEQDPATTTAPQAIKIPLGPPNSTNYFLVEARRRLLSDSLENGVGIWDEGVNILQVSETGDPPVTSIDSCDTTVQGGCDHQGDPNKPNYDTRTPNCKGVGPNVKTAADDPPYCWPYPLWHVGDTFSYSPMAIDIKIESTVGDCSTRGSLTCGYVVTVTRGVPPGHPYDFIIPWLTPPMNTYETVDIWVDSSCNGYETDVGPKGLRYGRRADGSVVGNGDDPCANHENRIYAHVRNGGDAPANNVTVHFQISDPLGVGVTGNWNTVGTATVPSIPPGGSADVYVPWTPILALTPQQIQQGHFRFHTCVQVIIDPVAGELLTNNHQAQENFDNFEAVMDPQTHQYAPIQGQFFINHGFEGTIAPVDRTYYLSVESELPQSWSYSVANGQTSLTLASNETRQVPVQIQVPPGQPIGQTYFLQVAATSEFTFPNDAAPPPYSTHTAGVTVGGVTLAAQTCLKADLSLTATVSSDGSKIMVKGSLTPPHANVIIAIDYTSANGTTLTHTVATDASGQFTDELLGPQVGSWQVRAIWQGDLDHCSAVSDAVVVTVERSTPPAQPVTWNVVSICEGCAAEPVQFAGATVNVTSPPLGNRTTPFSFEATLGASINLTASPVTSVSGSPLKFSRWRSLTDNSDLTTSATLTGTVNKAETLAAVYQPIGGSTSVTLTVEGRNVDNVLLKIPIQVLSPSKSALTTTFQLPVSAGTLVTLRAPKFTNGTDQCTAIVACPQFLRWRIGTQTITTNQQITITVNQNLTLVAEYQ